ncbi:hypothetical protein L7F22_048875 [Adiantum nelumboides]|nr:hypothetical protein [Adiantum nelumboides]
MSEHKGNWEQYLPLVEYAYNNIVHLSTSKAPFEIVEGGKKVPPILHTKDKVFEADKYLQDMDEMYKKVKMALEKTQAKQNKAANRHCREVVFSLGDWVLLRFEKARLKKMKGKERLFPKLSMRYYEPFQVSSGGYLGMFNSSTVGMLRNKVFAVEFDTHQNLPFKDPNDNHIGVDLNSVISLKTNNLSTLGIVLNEGKKLICWVDYDGHQRYLWVYLAHSPSDKPSSPAISMALDLAPYMKDNMYVGFSSATGTRAELHTIYSWWFLAGFGNLTLPLSPSSSTKPLAKLGRRNIVIAVFSLAVMVGFLCLICVYARGRWRRQSKHLVDILLPVACWMFWKESITSEVRSTRCLKLATPTVELLAWLWRTRLARKLDQLHAMTWWEVLLKRKMRLLHKGEAWHLEDKGRNRRKGNGAVHVLVFEERSEEDSCDEGDSEGRVNVIRQIKLCQLAESKSEKEKVLEEDEEASAAPSLVAEGQQREFTMQDEDRPVYKRYLIGTNSFIVLEESEAELFQRRGSFLIPQETPIDGQELADSKKDADPVVPPFATPQARSKQKKAGFVEVGFETGLRQLQPETLYMSADGSSSDKFFRRRGSFLVHPEDVVGLKGPTSSDKKDENVFVAQALAEHDADADSQKIDDVISPRTRSLQKPTASSTSKSATTHMQVQPEAMYITTDDSSSHQFSMRRGSFLVHPENVNLMGATSSTEKVAEPTVLCVVEHDRDRDSRRGIDLRRGSFMLPRVEQDIATTSRDRDVRRGSFILVEDASSSHKPEDRDQGIGSVLDQGSLLIPRVDREKESSLDRRIDVRRGSFILVDDAGSSFKPESRHQTEESVSNLKDSGLQNSFTSESAKPPQHPISRADEGSKSHVVHQWLFD